VALNELDFLDVRGVGALMAGTATYRSRGGHVRLQAPKPPVDRLIRLLGIDRSRGVLTKGDR
jgi:anti-anti-sigma regulatory factor